MISPEELGRTNFEAYNLSAGGLTYDNKPIPTWQNLTQKVRDNWIAGAIAVQEKLWGEVKLSK